MFRSAVMAIMAVMTIVAVMAVMAIMTVMTAMAVKAIDAIEAINAEEAAGTVEAVAEADSEQTRILLVLNLPLRRFGHIEIGNVQILQIIFKIIHRNTLHVM